VVVRGLTRPAHGALDWDAPWFAAVAPDGRAIAPAPDRRAALNALATARGIRAPGGPIRFVAAAAAGARSYEAHIGDTGEVPTRDDLHDFFNALAWLAFPATKARLNALQAGAIARAGVAGRRGALRDAATLMDENGLLLVTGRADLLDALRRHDWRALFVTQRTAWASDVRPLVFGHALMEKLTAPYKAITAHALAVTLPAGATQADVDRWVGAHLDEAFAPGSLLPLPVLGIPGWADNGDARFYDDVNVFRPARRASRQPVRQMGG
jgi:hypothetical protein